MGLHLERTKSSSFREIRMTLYASLGRSVSRIGRITRRFIGRRLERVARPGSRCLARHGFRLHDLSVTPVMPLVPMRLAGRSLVGRNGGETARLRLQGLVAGPVTLAVPHGGFHRLALAMATAQIGVAALVGFRLALARVLRVGCSRPRIRKKSLRCG